MTWIYYGSQLQFLNTLVRLVSNIFPFQRDRVEKEHQTLISWGWMGRGVGEAMPERMSSDGAQMFVMEYLSWKYSSWKILPQGALCQLERDWELWWVRMCLLFGFEGGAAWARHGGYRVILANLLWLWIFRQLPWKYKSFSLAVTPGGHGRIEQTLVEVGEECPQNPIHFGTRLLWVLGQVAWRQEATLLAIRLERSCTITPTESSPPFLGSCQSRLVCHSRASFEL